MSPYQLTLFILCLLGFLGCLVFVVQYQRYTRGAWRDRESGRWLMIGRAEKAALFLLVTVNQVIPDWPGRQAVTLTLFGIFVALTWWPARLLSKANRPRRTAEEVTR